jgi:hypothetical protein
MGKVLYSLTREDGPNIHSPGADFLLATENFHEPGREPGLADPRHG